MRHGFVQPPHLLLIDDDPDQLRLLVAALRDTSYRISVALNGDQGYARAAVLLPDLILLDMRMPGRNGVTVARLLKSNPATQHIPVLFLSAAAEKDERLTGASWRVRVTGSGADRALPRPAADSRQRAARGSRRAGLPLLPTGGRGPARRG